MLEAEDFHGHANIASGWEPGPIGGVVEASKLGFGKG